MIPLTKKCKTKSEEKKTDEGVPRGDGPTPPDPGGELVEDSLHLRAQDQEAPRVLGEAQSRVSLMERRGEKPNCILTLASARCGKTLGRFMFGGKYLE